MLVAVGNVSGSDNKFGKQTRFGLCFIVVVAVAADVLLLVLGVPNVCQRQAMLLLRLSFFVFCFFSF